MFRSVVVAAALAAIVLPTIASAQDKEEKPKPVRAKLVPVIVQGKPDDESVSVQTAPPVVVKTVPRAGETEVDAAKVTEIRATFSKDMADDSWSWSQISDETFPKTTGKAHFEADKRTCLLPVKLEPGKTYVLWLNPAKFQGFRDADGHAAVFYPLVFATKK